MCIRDRCNFCFAFFILYNVKHWRRTTDRESVRPVHCYWSFLLFFKSNSFGQSTNQKSIIFLSTTSRLAISKSQNLHPVLTSYLMTSNVHALGAGGDFTNVYTMIHATNLCKIFGTCYFFIATGIQTLVM